MTRPLFSHHNRVVVITGGGSGLGRAMAQAFTAQGARVLICGRRAEALKQTADRVGGPGELATHVADVIIPEAMTALAASAEKRWGPIQVWINNAGIMERGVFPDAEPESLQRMLEINVAGVMNGCRAAIAAMQADGGVILNISSYLSQHAGASATVPGYTATKGAVSALTRSLAVRHGPEGIRVNAICPALVPTELNPEVWEGHPDRGARDRELAEPYPLGRIGRPADVAAAALFLASDEAEWITGQELFVDGGMSAI